MIQTQNSIHIKSVSFLQLSKKVKTYQLLRVMNELVIERTFEMGNNSCFFITNLDFKILDLNPTITQLLNIPTQNFLGKNLLELVSGKSANTLLKKTKKKLSKEKWETEIELLSETKNLYPINVSVIPFVEKAIQKLLFKCQYTSNKDEKNYYTRLPNNIVLDQDAIVNSLDCALWAIDKDFQLIVFNDRFSSIIKKAFNIDPYHGMKIFDEINQEMKDYWLPFHQRALSGEKFTFELNLDSEIIEISYNPIQKSNQIIGITCFSRRITKTKKYQEELKLSEEKYKKLVETSPSAIVVFDLEDHKIVELNQSACELFKMSRERLMATKPWDLSPDIQEDGSISKDKFFYNIMEAFQGKNLEFEWTHTNSEGELIPCQVWLSKLPSQFKKQIRVSMLDIRERKNHQKELKSKEEKIRTIVSNVPVILWACNKQGILTFFDGDPGVLLNINPADAKSLSISEIFSENHNDLEQIRNLQNSKNDFSIQIFKNGKYFDLKARKLTDINGFFLGFTGILIDITESIESEKKIKSYIIQQAELIKKIKHQDAGLYSLINSTSDIIISVDTDLNIMEFNHVFNEMIKRGYDRTVSKGMNLRQFIMPEIEEMSISNFNKAFSGEIAKDVLTLQSRSEEVIFMSVIYTPIYSEKKEVIGVTLIGRDITESKRSEEQLMNINKQIAEYKLMALRSVMNPHFLFNSLNSIQYFVAKNERRFALDYLSVFSILIRKILHSSMNNTMPLSTELEILNYYIKLEQLRFENKFTSEIFIDPELNTEEIQIPSLLIQPYVENAILHGLTSKDTKGNLKIMIKKENQYLTITVEDDGIGRELAGKIKEQNDIVQEKSYGMLLTKERLDIINRTADVSVIIDDLKTDSGEPSGTRVKIMIKTAN